MSYSEAIRRSFIDSEKWKVRATAPSIEALDKLVQDRLYWSALDLKENGENTWLLKMKGKIKEDLRVIKKGKRYQLQQRIG